MDIFRGQEIIEFSQRFHSELDCKKYLAELKWKDGYACRKCGHQGSQIRKDFARTCNKCSDTESAGADTLFHKVKFGLLKVFHICFEMSTTTKGLSAMYVSKRYAINRKTAMNFMHKVREAMKSSGNYPMDGRGGPCGWICGRRERIGKARQELRWKEKKVVCAVELTKEGKVKRFYGLQIKDFSAKSLRPIFERHISAEAIVTTDEWKGCRPIAKDFQITQIPSDFGLNIRAMHTEIHQVKRWTRTTFSRVSNGHMGRCLNEYAHRLISSQIKQGIFHNLVKRMVNADKIYVEHLI